VLPVPRPLMTTVLALPSCSALWACVISVGASGPVLAQALSSAAAAAIRNVRVGVIGVGPPAANAVTAAAALPSGKAGAAAVE
jgi:hypothetical protein